MAVRGEYLGNMRLPVREVSLETSYSPWMFSCCAAL